MKGKRCRGLTIVELFLALVVLGILMVGVIGVFTTILLSSTKSADETAAGLVAQEQLESALTRGLPFRTSGTQYVYAHGDQMPLPFHYSIEAVELEPGGTFSRVFHVTAQVYWMVDNPTEGKMGYGDKMSTSVSRIVHSTR